MAFTESVPKFPTVRISVTAEGFRVGTQMEKWGEVNDILGALIMARREDSWPILIETSARPAYERLWFATWKRTIGYKRTDVKALLAKLESLKDARLARYFEKMVTYVTEI